MYRLSRQGVDLGFLDVGRGAPPIVLIHDLATDHSCFDPQIERYRRHHRVVAVDLRGHGESGGPGEPCTVASLAGDTAWLCYELGLWFPIIVGHGFGGMVGIELSARHPDLPAAVVALDSAAIPLSRMSSLARWLDAPPEPDRAAVSAPAVASGWKSALAWDGATAAAVCRVPLFFIDAIGEGAGIGREPHTEWGHPYRLPEQADRLLDDLVRLVARRAPSPQ